MYNLNLIVLEGTLIRDPELQECETGIPKCCFTLVNHASGFQDAQWFEEVNFINVVTWSKVAEKCAEFLQKESTVRVRGRLHQQTVSDRSGNNYSLIEINAQHVDLIFPATGERKIA